MPQQTLTKNDLKLLYTAEQIDAAIAQLSLQIDKDYQGKRPIVLFILKGALFFTADLLRKMELTCELQSIRCSSYGMGGSVRKQLKISGLEELEISGHDVLIVDDICDSGYTLATVVKKIEDLGAGSVKTAVLADHGCEREMPFTPDYAALTTPQGMWLVGYGFDYKEQFRTLPDIYGLPPEVSSSGA